MQLAGLRGNRTGIPVAQTSPSNQLSHPSTYSLIFNSPFLFADQLISGIFADYFCHKKCGLSHFFPSHLSTCPEKHDSSLSLKYISRKGKKVFWKVVRKKSESMPRMERCWVATHMITNFVDVECSANILLFVDCIKRCGWNILKYESTYQFQKSMHNITPLL